MQDSLASKSPELASTLLRILKFRRHIVTLAPQNVWMIQLLDWPWGKNKLRRSQLPVLVSSLVYLFRLHLSVYHHLPLRFSVSICFSLVADQLAANHKGRAQPECPCWDRNRNDLARCPDFFRTVIIGGRHPRMAKGILPEISGKYFEVTSL